MKIFKLIGNIFRTTRMLYLLGKLKEMIKESQEEKLKLMAENMQLKEESLQLQEERRIRLQANGMGGANR
jgi:hypothetical protein